jgi:HK97 family phage prohead protease
MKNATLPIKSLDEEARSFDVIASTDAVDSFGETVDQDWALERFMANPVVLFGHDAGSLPIGRASNVRVEEGQLRATVHLVDEKANPLAEQVWQSVKQGALRAVSVGFVSKNRRTEERGGKKVSVLSGNELHELSVVPLPVNPEALAMGMNARERREERQMKAVLGKLGLNETATEADALMAIDELQDAARGLQSTTATRNVKGALGALDAMRVKAERVDALEADLAKIRADQEQAEINGLVDGAIAEGKLFASEKGGLLEDAKKHGIEFVRAFVGKLPKRINVKGDVQASGRTVVAGETRLEAEVEAELRRFGTPVDEKTLKAFQNAKAMPRVEVK